MTTKRDICPTTGCWNLGTPFCSKHLKPYAVHLLDEIAKQEGEVAKAKSGRWKEIDVKGSLAREFLRVVRERGRASIERVSRECFRDTEVAKAYMRALRKAGLVETTRNVRGVTLVYIPQRKKART